ncbi:DMT family transporter [Lichenicola sp.]|uniref:DMT family transporter n=1 Tax=Lichenicola sp. TaxID=2804529 RepID=UPI003B00864C
MNSRITLVHGAPIPARDWLMLVGLSFLWGGSFFFYKLLAPVLPPFTLVLGRVGIAALVLHAVLLARGNPLRPTPRLVGWFLLLGALSSALPFCLFAWSEQRISSGLAAILNSPTPIVTALVAHFATRDERLTWRTLVGAIFGLAGVLVLIAPSLPVGGMSGSGVSDLLPELACVGATITYAVGGVLARRVHGVAPLQFAAGQMSGAAIVTLPFAVFGDRFWTLPPLPASGWAALLGIALLSTALAYLLYFRILASSGATRAAMVTFLVPVSALLLGVAFLAEPVTARDIAGIAIIGAGLAVIDGRMLRVLRRRPRVAE